MESLEVLVANDLVERVDRLLESFGRPQVMPGSKGMASIDTDAYSLLVLDQSNDVSQVLPRRPNDVATPCHVLKNRYNSLGGLVRLVQLCRNSPNRSSPTVTARRSGMEVVQPDTQLLASVEVIEEAGIRLIGFFLVGLCQVDQIRAVREGVLGGAVAMMLALRNELGLGRGVEGRVGPFALRLEEEGEGVGADVDGVGDRVLYA